MSEQRGAAQPARRISIGPLLKRLEPDFPGITASKIRFLEEQGLVRPERTPSGYRKYSSEDLERLRAVLRLQRGHYMPLKVIREIADAGRLMDFQEPIGAAVSAQTGDSGQEVGSAQGAGTSQGSAPASIDDGTATSTSAPELSPSADAPMSLRELCRRSGAGMPLVRELLSFGLLQDGPGRFDGHDVVVASAARELHAFGVEPRHLRTLKQAADREIGLVEQAVATEATRRTQESSRRAAQRAQEISRLCLSLHASLVSSRLQDLQRGIAPEEPSGS